MRRIPRRQHHFNEKEAAVRAHGLAAVLQNGDALILVPVVDNVRQHVGITALWNALEEVARTYGYAVRNTPLLQEGRRVGNDVGPVEQDAARSGMA